MKPVFSGAVVVTLVLGSLTWSAPAEAAFRFAIVAIDARSGVVTARDQATGETFQFVVTDKRALNSLKVGAGGSFDRRSGLAIQGLPQGSYKLVKSPKPKDKPEIDCSSFPQLCPGGKRQPPLTTDPGPGGDPVGQINDFCFDNPDQCLPGPV